MYLSYLSILIKFKTVFQTGTAHHPVRIHLRHRLFGDLDLTSIQSSSIFSKANAFHPIMKYMDLVTDGRIRSFIVTVQDIRAFWNGSFLLTVIHMFSSILSIRYVLSYLIF